jgi:hypothetical protein
MTPQERTANGPHRDTRPEPETLGVAMIGYAFMGKANSTAWRNCAS